MNSQSAVCIVEHLIKQYRYIKNW